MPLCPAPKQLRPTLLRHPLPFRVRQIRLHAPNALPVRKSLPFRRPRQPAPPGRLLACCSQGRRPHRFRLRLTRDRDKRKVAARTGSACACRGPVSVAAVGVRAVGAGALRARSVRFRPGRSRADRLRILSEGRGVAATRPPQPHRPAVAAGEEVVDVDPHVGVEACIVVDEDVDRRHHDARGPEPNAGFVFEVEVEQPDERADDFERLHPVRVVRI